MKRSLFQLLSAGSKFLTGHGHRIVTMEQTRYCNRRCPYCEVPNLYNPQEELSIEESKNLVDRLYGWGYRALSYLGGEPLSKQLTKEGISIWEHTLEVVRHASARGFFTNLTSNGDYLTEEKLKQLADAGLGSLSLSFHSYTLKSLEFLVEKLVVAAKLNMIPVLTTVFTSERVQAIPAIASYVTRQGILFSIGICQDYGGPFSKQCVSLVPTRDQQRYVFDALLRLKRIGFIRNNNNYLQQAIDYYPNSWKCDHTRDTFLHVGAGGTLDVCSEVRTNLKYTDVPNLDTDQWRNLKRALVSNCRNCLSQCYFEAQNPSPWGDLPMFLMGLLISSGKHDLARSWAEYWTTKVTSRATNVNWDVELPGSNLTPLLNIASESIVSII